MRKVLEVIWGARKRKYFCKQDWTGGIKLIYLNNSAVRVRGIARMKRSALRDCDAAIEVLRIPLRSVSGLRLLEVDWIACRGLDGGRHEPNAAE
jgi:hypothetical protein